MLASSARSRCQLEQPSTRRSRIQVAYTHGINRDVLLCLTARSDRKLHRISFRHSFPRIPSEKIWLTYAFLSRHLVQPYFPCASSPESRTYSTVIPRTLGEVIFSFGFISRKYDQHSSCFERISPTYDTVYQKAQPIVLHSRATLYTLL